MSQRSRLGRLAAHPPMQLAVELARAAALGGSALVRSSGPAAPPGPSLDLITPPVVATLAFAALLVGVRYVERRRPQRRAAGGAAPGATSPSAATVPPEPA